MTEAEYSNLVSRMRGRLELFFGRMLRGASLPDEPEDLVQETFERLWKCHREINPRVRPVEGLVMTIARNLFLDKVRSARKFGERVEYSDFLGLSYDPEVEAMWTERVERLDAVLAEFDESDRTVISLYHIDGYDVRTIASLLGASEGAIRTRLCRARRRVARAFGIAEP